MASNGRAGVASVSRFAARRPGDHAPARSHSTKASAASRDGVGDLEEEGADFSFDGWTSVDLETLAATMRAIRPGEVELVACGSEATWALQAVAQRLNDLPLKLQTLPASAPACAGAPAFRAESQRIDMASADHAAVARYWAQVMP